MKPPKQSLDREKYPHSQKIQIPSIIPFGLCLQPLGRLSAHRRPEHLRLYKPPEQSQQNSPPVTVSGSSGVGNGLSLPPAWFCPELPRQGSAPRSLPTAAVEQFPARPSGLRVSRLGASIFLFTSPGVPVASTGQVPPASPRIWLGFVPAAPGSSSSACPRAIPSSCFSAPQSPENPTAGSNRRLSAEVPRSLCSVSCVLSCH